MEDNTMFVDFEKYCPMCRYKDLREVKDPCNKCLDISAREGTEKPEYYSPIRTNFNSYNSK